MPLPPNSELSAMENYLTDLQERDEPFLLLRGDASDSERFYPELLTKTAEFNLHGRHFAPVYHAHDVMLVLRPRKLLTDDRHQAGTALRADAAAWKNKYQLGFSIHQYGQKVQWPTRQHGAESYLLKPAQDIPVTPSRGRMN